MDVYDNPKYYEIAFSFRDIPKEVDFIEQVIAKESKIPVKTFLEIASGNSPHMQELCSRGYGYIGLELSKPMVTYSRDKIKRLGLNAEIVEGDMIKFSIHRLADCTLLFLGSLYIKGDDELLNHLNSVAKTLNSGGLYILDGAVTFFPEDVHTQSWEMEEGGIKVTTTYKVESTDVDTRILKAKIILDIDDAGEKKIIEHLEIRKIYSADEFISRATQSGQWEYIDAFSNFNIANKPQKRQRNSIVLRRK
jgi:hypothetical protein